MNLKVLLIFALVYFIFETEAKSTDESSINKVVARREKKDGQLMHRVFMGLMLAKSMISMLLMFLSPILQIKGLGLSLVNVIINVTRFIMQLKDRKAEPQPYKVHHVSAQHLPQYVPAHHEEIQDWSSSGVYGQYLSGNQQFSNQPVGMDWASSNQYKSFGPSVNTADSYLPQGSEISSSWSSQPVGNEAKLAQSNSETNSNLKIQTPTLSYLTHNKKIA